MTQSYTVYIGASPERIWEAITTPELTRGYLFGAEVETTGEPGTPFRYWAPDRSALWGDDTVLEAERPTRLVVSYRGLYDPELAEEPPSSVSWRIEPDEGGVTKLTVVHERLDEAPKTAARVGAGWMRVLSGLKTLLETGRPLA